MARQAPAWAGVGSANAPSNQARVAGENPSSASAVPVSADSSAIVPYCLAPPTFPAAARTGDRPLAVYLCRTGRGIRPRALHGSGAGRARLEMSPYQRSDHTAHVHHADHVLGDLIEHAITIKP